MITLTPGARNAVSMNKKIKTRGRDVCKWISVIESPHPIGREFLAYYGNSCLSKRINVAYLDGKELAVSHWMGIPPLPTLADEYEDICSVSDTE